MSSAREIKARVREQLKDQVKIRQDSAMAVASAWAKVTAARERLAAAETTAAEVVAAQSESVTISELAELTGINAGDLRRLSRNPSTTSDARR